MLTAKNLFDDAIAKYHTMVLDRNGSKEVLLAFDKAAEMAGKEAQNTGGAAGNALHNLLARCHVGRAQRLLCHHLNDWNNVGHDPLGQAEVAIKTALGLQDLSDQHAILQAIAARPFEIDEQAELLYTLGFIHRSRGRHCASLDAFARCLGIKPDNIRARAQLANQYMNLGDSDNALKQIDIAIKEAESRKRNKVAMPGLGWSYWIKGRTHFFRGEYNQAVECLNKSVEDWQDLWYNEAYLIAALALNNELARAESRMEGFRTRFDDITLTRIKENEALIPEPHDCITEGRVRLHAALLRAGLPE